MFKNSFDGCAIKNYLVGLNFKNEYIQKKKQNKIEGYCVHIFIWTYISSICLKAINLFMHKSI